MVVKIKHSARGLADAPQVDAPADAPQIDNYDLKSFMVGWQVEFKKSNDQINERLDGIENSSQQIHQRLDNIEVQISIE
jgi:hypothetical protein